MWTLVLRQGLMVGAMLVGAASANGHTTTHAYDLANQRTETRRPQNSITTTYHPWGDVETVTDPDGVRTAHTYDLRRRPLSETRSGPGGDETTAYVHDGNGNRTARIPPKGADYTWTYEYDDANRLIRIDSPTGAITRPNPQDRLATLTAPTGPPVHYHYDTDGKRTDKRSTAEAIRFHWDGQQLRRETNTLGNELAAYDWAGRTLLTSTRSGTRLHAQHDALHSPVRWSEDSGSEHGSIQYDAWGQTTPSTPGLPNIAYTGHYLDPESGSYYAQQRYYRPELGRFNRIDPWSGDPLNPVTLNKYLYANGNPLAYVDLDGRIAILDEDLRSEVSGLTEGSLAMAETAAAAMAEAPWYAQPGLALTWAGGGVGYVGGQIGDFVVSGGNWAANAVVAGTDQLGDAVGVSETAFSGLAREAYAEADRLKETVVPAVEAFAARPGESSMAIGGAIASGAAARLTSAANGESRSIFDVASNLNPARMLEGLRSSILHAAQPGRSVAPSTAVIVGEGANGQAAVQGVQTSVPSLDARINSRMYSGDKYRDTTGRLQYEGGGYAPDGAARAAAAVARSQRPPHGNTAGDQLAYLYARYDAEGNFQKWGITQDMRKRYPTSKLAGGELIPVETGPRRAMLRRERELTEMQPGPLNLEPWAGRRRDHE